MAEAIIGRLLLRVLQDIIGFVDFLELVLGRLVARIGIGMKLLGELAKGALQLALIGAFVNAQDLIIVAFGHADPSAQLFLTQVSPSPEMKPSPRASREEKVRYCGPFEAMS